ncbi:hypothetical protein [Geodermatophilus sp. URMC 64]
MRSSALRWVRALAGLLAGCLVLSAAGCGSFADTTAEDRAAPASADGSSSAPPPPAVSPTTTAPTTASPTTASSPASAASWTADWSTGLAGWAGPGDWKPLDGLLVNDGTGEYSVFRPILAPYRPAARDYAVEAEIRVTSATQASSFGLVVRAGADGTGYAAGVGAGWDQTTGISDLTGWWGSADLSGRLVDGAVFDPGADWHTYRVEVRANVVRLLVDGTEFAAVTDNKYLEAGRVGLWCNRYQVEVRRFAVLPV